MSLLLDALRRLEVGPARKSAPAPAAARQPRAARIEEPAAATAATPVPTDVTTDTSVESARPEPVFAVPPGVAADVATQRFVEPTPAETPVARESEGFNADDDEVTVEAAWVPPVEPRTTAWTIAATTPVDVGPEPRAVEIDGMTTPAIATAADVEPRYVPPRREPAMVEIPQPPQTFDCRGLAAALLRQRRAGGKFVFVSVGDDETATGLPEWSAELADELSLIAAQPVERFASGGLALESVEPASTSRGFRLYFVGASFATSRGARLRNADGVLLVVREGITSLRGADVVRGALAAQQVEFAGFVYVAR